MKIRSDPNNNAWPESLVQWNLGIDLIELPQCKNDDHKIDQKSKDVYMYGYHNIYNVYNVYGGPGMNMHIWILSWVSGDV